LDKQIEFIATDEVKEALSILGRTEDVKFSPNSRRLAIAGYKKNKCLVVDIQFEFSSTCKKVLLIDFVEISSPSFQKPHGLYFIDQETLIVANRRGAVPILKLPPSGMGGKTLAISALRTIRSSQSLRLKSPGSVSVSRFGHGLYEVLVCNNYVNYVTRHVLDKRANFEIKRSEIMLSNGLDLPDGVAVNRDRRWIAISNHNTHSVLLYKNTWQLSRYSEPAAILRNANFPHGLRFTPDDNFVLVANAGRPFVHVYAKKDNGWHGTHDPVTSVRVMDTETFLRGRHNPAEGGPKGIDIDSEMNVLVTTSKHQPIAFFDLPEILKVSQLTPTDISQMYCAT
jgi:hypothetical protein